MRRRLLLFLSSLFVLCTALFFRADLSATAQDDSDEAYRLVGSHYNVRDYDATLMLNNKGPDPIEQLITVFSSDGQSELLGPIAVEGSSYSVVSLNELIGALGRAFETGSLEVAYRGQFLEMGAQIRLSNGGSVIEEQLVRPEQEFASSRLDGVFFLPSRQAAFKVAVANTSGESVRVRMTISQPDGASETIRFGLGPRASRVLDARSLVKGNYGGITIEHNGEPGSVAANAFIVDESIRYSAIVGLSDCGKAETNELHGGGLRLRQVNGDAVKPAVLVRNLGAESTTVSVTVPVTVAETVYRAQVPDVDLAPGQTRLLSEEVSQAVAFYVDPEMVDSAGVEVRYTGPPGSVAAEALSASASGNHVFRVPLIDPEGHFSASGGFPWNLDGGQTTVFYVKNMTSVRQMHYWYLDFQAGRYAGDSSYLDPGATLALDIRQLRDDQVPDRRGRTIPEDVTRGQIFWSKLNGGKKALAGRVEQFDPLGTAITYACENCCPDEVVFFFVDPFTILDVVGNSAAFSFFGTTQGCYGNEGEEFEISHADISLAPPTFLGYQNGVVTCLAAGSGIIDVDWQFTNFVTAFAPGEGALAECEEEEGHFSEQVPAETFNISISGASTSSPGIQDEPPTVTLTVDMGKVPSSAVNVTMRAKVRTPGSGGHSHEGTTPTRPTPRVEKNNSWAQEQVFSVTTQTFTLKFKPSMADNNTKRGIAGEYSVEAEFAGNVEATHEIDVKVALQELTAGALYHLRKVDNRHNSGDYHYGTQAANQAIKDAAQMYWNQRGSSQSPTEKMVVNDQSLVWGGFFGIPQADEWSINKGLTLWGHQTHRDGRNVDIPFKYWDGSAERSVSPTSDQGLALKDALDDHFGVGNCQPHPPAPNTANHWHCTKN